MLLGRLPADAVTTSDAEVCGSLSELCVCTAAHLLPFSTFILFSSAPVEVVNKQT